MNCAEFIDILKSGQPIILRRHSKEYVRVSENSLSVVSEAGTHVCLWLAANRKFKRTLRRFSSHIPNFGETSCFLNKWDDMREARNWSPENFPGLREIATFVYLTLVPEYWMICLEVGEEAVPLVQHGELHTGVSDYDT